jgi:hypothetical protein
MRPAFGEACRSAIVAADQESMDLRSHNCRQQVRRNAPAPANSR